jgi:hypothetical protein
MTTSALSSDPHTNDNTRAVPATEKQPSTKKSKSLATRPRPKTPRIAAIPAKPARAIEPHRGVEARRIQALAEGQKSTTQYGAVLVGAGIGAAVTLSVVAIGIGSGRRSALGAAVTKSISYAIAHGTARGSLVNWVARALHNIAHINM